MARIRSVHPGLFTDEDFVSRSDAAQIFFVALLTECDDQGLFEWKPLTLKMKLRPASMEPVDGLLVELLAGRQLRQYEIDGRKFGAIRNFRKYQKPKSPNAVHPMNEDIRKYVGLSDAISEIEPAEPPPIPPKAEKSPQMEDGGGRVEDEGGKKVPLAKINGLISHAAASKPNISGEEKRRRWAAKVTTWLYANEQPDRADQIVEAWQRGEGWAQEQFERVSKILQASKGAA